MDQETSKNQRLSLILSALSLLGVVVLFILHFTGAGTKSRSSLDNKAISAPNSGNTVAYIHTDSILKNYELVKDFASKLEVKTKKFAETIESKQSEFEYEAAYFEESVPKRFINNFRRSNSLSWR